MKKDMYFLSFLLKSLFLGRGLSYYPEYLIHKKFHAFSSFILGYDLVPDKLELPLNFNSFCKISIKH